MAAAAPWSVKGINPRAREVAKDLARRSGMTLGEWLNRVILEDDMPEEVTSEADFGKRRASEAPRLRLAASTPAGQAPGHTADDHLVRVVDALDRLTSRIEASETRTGLAIAGVEHSVRQASSRIDVNERPHLFVASRQDDLEALRRPDADIIGPRSAETVRTLYPAPRGAETAGVAWDIVARLGERVADAEQRTAEALGSLQTSLVALDERMRTVEGEGRPEIDRRLETLGAELSQRVEQARLDALSKLQTAGTGGLEERLAQMADQVAAAERRSAAAIEKMGREVLSLAEVLNRRLENVENQSANALEQASGEMLRIGVISEARLVQAEQTQAEVLEKLGVEITRVTERLTDGILQSERRAAQAINDVGEQVARVTERMEHRHDRLANDLAERIRESDERLARLLDGRAPTPSVESAAVTADAVEELAEVSPPVHAFGPQLLARAEPVLTDVAEEIVFAPAAADDSETFAPLADSDDDEVFRDDVDSETDSERPLSTREVIDQARIAARANAATRPDQGKRRQDRPRRVLGALGFRTGARQTSTWQAALVFAGGAAVLSVGAAGVAVMERPATNVTAEIASAPVTSTARAAVALSPQVLSAQPAADKLDEQNAPADPAMEYVSAVHDVEAGQAGGLARLNAVAQSGYAPAQFYLAKLYESGKSGVVKNAAQARVWTERAAEGGEASAMHNLALYYFRGEGGAQDLTAAAGWFRKAAERGLVDSQYNLGLLYESGSGVKRDLGEAYKWFAIAADNGDQQARVNAADLGPKLSPSVIATAEAAASAFQPANETLAETGAPSRAALAAAQKILGRLGYYSGPTNGAGSSHTKLALQAYQRDHGLAATGALDLNTASRLAVYAR